MAKNVKPIPEGYHSVTPYLIVSGVPKLMEFLKQAFDAKETVRMASPDGTVNHAEMVIGDSKVMMGELEPSRQRTPAGLYVYVADADKTYRRALEAGATSLMEPADQFYGDRSGGVVDAFGNTWWIATHIEDVAPQEMKQRAAAAMQKATQKATGSKSS